jgi:hypothetical protein
VLRRAAVLGCLGMLVPALAVVAGLLVAGDVAARRYATGQLSDRVSAAVPEASGVHARIRSFPFLGRILFNASISDVGVHIDRVAVAGGLAFSDLDVDLRTVVLDGDVLWNQRRVVLRRIGRGTVSVSVTDTDLSSVLGRAVTVQGGAISVVLLGRPVAASVQVSSARQLTVTIGRLPAYTVALPSAKVLPCHPKLTITTGRMVLGCAFTGIPPAFVEP